MSVVPKKRIDRVQFYEDHIDPFTTNATAIGLVAADVTDLQTKTAAARAAYNTQQATMQAARAATEAFYNAVRTMSIAGDAIIEKIRGKASVSGNPDVYTLAQIPGPSTPTPSGPPGKPYDFAVEIDQTGALKSKWKNSNARGAVYMIYRRLGETGEFVNIGGVGTKKFTDYDVPAGTAVVQYQIQAVRSTGKSPWALFVVNLGMQTGMANVVESEPSRLAA